MSASLADILGAARDRAGLTERDLWVGYYALGGTAGPQTLSAYLDGTVVPSGAEYDVIVQVLNDVFVSRGETDLVPYAEDVQT